MNLFSNIYINKKIVSKSKNSRYHFYIYLDSFFFILRCAKSTTATSINIVSSRSIKIKTQLQLRIKQFFVSPENFYCFFLFAVYTVVFSC